jgi:hypothetical protein
MTPAQAQERDLARRLLSIAEAMVASRATNLSTDAIRELPGIVKASRWSLIDEDIPRLIDAEAACVVELLAALTYARDDANAPREARIVELIKYFIPLMQQDLAGVTA